MSATTVSRSISSERYEPVKTLRGLPARGRDAGAHLAPSAVEVRIVDPQLTENS